jgi:hypothetical protein
VPAGHTYTASLVWKTNKPDPGSIFIGAGPLGGDYSPTRLNVQVVPVSDATVFRLGTRFQLHLTGSNGSTWVAMDNTNLTEVVHVPAGNWDAVVAANADLFTAKAGYNQDIGIAVTGGVYPSTVGQPEVWKESGGFAGTFSPNAAFVQGVLPVAASTDYTVSVVWKTNKPDPGTIYAGAGPVAGSFSPSYVIVYLVPAPSGEASTVITSQVSQANSDGTYLSQVHSALALDFTPASTTSYVVSGNADLWTANAGFNQDLGIMVSGGAYGSGTLVAWKESGGFAGTFSPNAAFVAADLHLQGGVEYRIWLVWKANRIAVVANNIYIGAGPIALKFSPTWLAAVAVSSP